ncbi:DUF6624 domain-containing protein [Sphingobacterium faecale]|uniref:Uncharacterized protein n=1 Tax=Sphingobacterium faecale TaxID=2803775 RepID=A0ABS1RB44_9SPHI|nr:DUF6624 domain-containing protein [Sphingobacterium faecale]MBL1411056.1 hypothetical protein [Sphingobacterium faecale]
MYHYKPFLTLLCCTALLLSSVPAYSQTKLALENINEKLEEVYTTDQLTRRELNEAQKKYGYGSKEFNERLNAMNVQDSINRGIALNILDRFGWLDKTVLSDKANKAFFYTIQHADLETQIKYKHFMEEAFRSGQISNHEYAIFQDRLSVRLGKNQLFGSQTAFDNIGNSYLYPVDNIDSIHRRRAEIGLQELELQLKQSNIKYDFPQSNSSIYDITLIGHFWNTSNIGVANIAVWHGENLIGKSDLNGFLFSKYSFFDKDEITLTFRQLDKTVGQQQIKKGKDFYELYIQIKQ